MRKRLSDELDLPPPSGEEAQPVSTVRWVHRDQLRANDYNPNHQAPPERDLLRVSLLADGWTQPIVARHDMEIVDGYHRWLTSADPAVAAMTNGLVPVVFLRKEATPAHQRMSTIRHNRARGEHGIAPMAEIARRLVDEEAATSEELQVLLGMESEEVDRLMLVAGMPEVAGKEAFSPGWTPTTDDVYAKSPVADDALREDDPDDIAGDD